MIIQRCALSLVATLLVVSLPWLLAQDAASDQPTSPDAALTVHPGEIRLDGWLLATNTTQHALIVAVISYTLPNGRSSTLVSPSRKVVRMQAGTTITSQQPSRQDLALGALRPSMTITAIGPDSGSGHDLYARIVTVGPSAAPAPLGQSPAALTAPQILLRCRQAYDALYS